MDNAIATVGAPALPEHLKNYQGPLGTEGIETQDITVPRLKIGQGTSPEVKSGQVKEGALFLNVTGETLWNIGDQPLAAIVVAQGKEYILWRPRKDNGGGLLARARPVRDAGVTRYKWDNSDQAFEVKVEGVVKATWKTQKFVDQDGLHRWGSEIPGDPKSGIAATEHSNFVVFLPTLGMVASISMSRSQAKKARDLRYVIAGSTQGIPIFGFLLGLTTMDEHSGDNQYKNWNVRPAGIVPADLFNKASELFVRFEKGFIVDQSDEEQTEKASPAVVGGKATRKV